MTINECQVKVWELFSLLFPECTVIFENSDTVRPECPYIVLKFGAIRNNGRFSGFEDGEVKEFWNTAVALTVDMYGNGSIYHDADTKGSIAPDVLQSLSAVIPFLESEYARAWMRGNCVVIEPDGEPFPVYGTSNGISTTTRVQCAFAVRFVREVYGYSSLEENAVTGSRSSPSAELASMRTGYFTNTSFNLEKE